MYVFFPYKSARKYLIYGYLYSSTRRLFLVRCAMGMQVRVRAKDVFMFRSRSLTRITLFSVYVKAHYVCAISAVY